MKTKKKRRPKSKSGPNPAGLMVLHPKSVVLFGALKVAIDTSFVEGPLSKS